MNNLIKIQNSLMQEMERLNTINTEECALEVARSNALSQSANTFIKTLNVAIRVKEISDKTETDINKLNEELGIYYEK